MRERGEAASATELHWRLMAATLAGIALGLGGRAAAAWRAAAA